MTHHRSFYIILYSFNLYQLHTEISNLKKDLETEKMLNHRLQLQNFERSQLKKDSEDMNVCYQPVDTSSATVMLLKNSMEPKKIGVG